MYNRTRYLELTLRSVLAQDPGAEVMQIEVVDDASTMNDPEALVRRVGGDRVAFFRQSRNVGQQSNLNTCVERSRGQWVHLLHDDDLVFTGFYARFQTALEGRDEVGAAFCRHAIIDENGRRLRTSALESPTAGILPAFVEKIGASTRIQTPSIVVRRSVYEQVGGFRRDLPFAGDREMWIRVAAHYPIWYEPEILAGWRVHPNSVTAAAMRSAENIVDGRRCIEISYSWLPPDRADAISRRAKEWMAIFAFDNAYMALGRAEFKTAYRQVRGGLKTIVTPHVMRNLLWQILRIPMGGVRRIFRVSKRLLGRESSDHEMQLGPKL